MTAISNEKLAELDRWISRLSDVDPSDGLSLTKDELLALRERIRLADALIELVAEARDWNHIRGWEDNCKCQICKGLVIYRSATEGE